MKVTQNMLLAVRKTRPWVMTLSFIGFIIVLGMWGAAARLIQLELTEELPTQKSALYLTLAGTLILNGIMAVLPSIRLWAFGACCGQFLATSAGSALAHALEEHRKFWHIWGILTISSTALNGTVALVLLLVLRG